MNQSKILIVDDEPRNQRIIMETLEALGEIVIVDNGEEALEVVERFKPDIILLDIMMPGIDGYEVCKRIKTNPAHLLTKIILVSGKAMIEERLQGYACGADDYMTKPFVHEELLAKVKVYSRLVHVENELIKLNGLLEEKVKNKSKMLMDAEEKIVSSASLLDISTPLKNIKVLTKHIAEIVSAPVVDEDLVIEKTKLIEKTLDRVHVILDSSSSGSEEKKAI